MFLIGDAFFQTDGSNSYGLVGFFLSTLCGCNCVWSSTL